MAAPRKSKKEVAFGGRMVMIGFGSIGQGVMPLILRHIAIKPSQITVISAEDRGGLPELETYGITFIRKRLTRANYRAELSKLVRKGDFIVNLSVEVASTALIEFAQEKGALYIDTCIEPWPGGYTDPNLTPSQRSNYALRETVLRRNIYDWMLEVFDTIVGLDLRTPNREAPLIPVGRGTAPR